MIIEYKEKVNLRVNDFDCNDNILVSSILDLFQNVAGKHATKLGVGYNELLKKNRAWMIVRTKIHIIKQPKQEETVTIRTWPLPLNKIDANRCYEMVNENNEVLIRGISKWVNVDINLRRVVRLDIDYGIGEFDHDHNLLENFEKIKEIEDCINVVKVIPSYLDLDHNGHVNNSKYINFAMNNIKELQNKEIKCCQIEYIKELQKEQEFDLSYKVDSDEVFVVGKVGPDTHFKLKFVL